MFDKRLWSLLRWVYRDNRSRLGIEKARKMALISMFNRSDESDMDVFQDDLLLDSLIDLHDDSEVFDDNETDLTQQ